MYNYFSIIGKVASVEPKEQDGKRISTIRLKVGKPTTLPEDENRYDIITVFAFDFLADIANEHVLEGQTIFVKGSMSPKQYDDANWLIAERIVFMEK